MADKSRKCLIRVEQGMVTDKHLSRMASITIHSLDIFMTH